MALPVNTNLDIRTHVLSHASPEEWDNWGLATRRRQQDVVESGMRRTAG